MNDYTKIQLGGRVRSIKYVLVDDIDLELINKYSWYCKQGYAATNITRGQTVYMHRMILGLQAGDRKECDHINRDKLDNRRKNLRLVTKSQNNMNTVWFKTGSSKYKGVHWHKQRKKWKAQIRANNHIYYLGIFTNEIDAAIAYDNAAQIIHGEFACLNFHGKCQAKVPKRS